MEEESKKQKSSADIQWEQISEILPERVDVKMPEDSNDLESDLGHGTLGQNMRGSPKLSDVQTIDKRLFPDLQKSWLNNLLVSRVFPDLYNDLFEIIVKGLLMENTDMTLEEAVCTAEVALSIPIDGEGRIDAIAVLGSPQATTESDKNKGLGIL
jgi:hypothetical protein